MFDDFGGNIYIRPSQEKFRIKNVHPTDNYFEFCDYSRFIQAYLNRQIILLMKANGIKDEIFFKKLFEFKMKLENDKFVLSELHQVE